MLEALGYKYVRWHPERTGKGLHGTAILSRIIPNSLKVGYSSPDVHTTDDDGRVLSAVFPNFTILHTYSPCSSWPANADRTEQQQKAKDDARRQFDKDINEDIRFLQTHHKTPVVWCGDMNVIHLDRDVWHAQFAAADSPWAGAKSWERDNFRKIRRDRGLKDAYLETCLNPKRPEFTYWRPNQRKFNEGWRLDRVLCPQSMLSDGNHARIPIVHTLTDVQGSDHCPLLFTVQNPLSLYAQPQTAVKGKTSRSEGAVKSKRTAKGRRKDAATPRRRIADDLGKNASRPRRSEAVQPTAVVKSPWKKPYNPKRSVVCDPKVQTTAGPLMVITLQQTLAPPRRPVNTGLKQSASSPSGLATQHRTANGSSKIVAAPSCQTLADRKTPLLTTVGTAAPSRSANAQHLGLASPRRNSLAGTRMPTTKRLKSPVFEGLTTRPALHDGASRRVLFERADRAVAGTRPHNPLSTDNLVHDYAQRSHLVPSIPSSPNTTAPFGTPMPNDRPRCLPDFWQTDEPKDEQSDDDDDFFTYLGKMLHDEPDAEGDFLNCISNLGEADFDRSEQERLTPELLSDPALPRGIDSNRDTHKPFLLQQLQECISGKNQETMFKTPSLKSLRRAQVVKASVPMAWVMIQNVRLKCLFDSGASYSVISQDVFARANLLLQQPGSRTPTPTFQMADGGTSRPVGFVWAPLSYGGITYKHALWVVPVLPLGLIMGCDFFCRTGAIMDFGKMTIAFPRVPGAETIQFHIQHEAVTNRGAVAPLALLEDLWVLPGTRHCTTLRTLNGDNLSEGLQDGLVHRMGSGCNPQHMIARSISRLDDGSLRAQLANFSDKPCFMRAGTLLASFTPVTVVSKDTPTLEGDDQMDLRFFPTKKASVILYYQDTVLLVRQGEEKTWSLPGGRRDVSDNHLYDTTDRGFTETMGFSLQTLEVDKWSPSFTIRDAEDTFYAHSVAPAQLQKALALAQDCKKVEVQTFQIDSLTKGNTGCSDVIRRVLTRLTTNRTKPYLDQSDRRTQDETTPSETIPAEPPPRPLSPEPKSRMKNSNLGNRQSHPGKEKTSCLEDFFANTPTIPTAYLRNTKKESNPPETGVYLNPVNIDEQPEPQVLDENGIPVEIDLTTAKANLTPAQFQRLLALLREFHDIFASKTDAPTVSHRHEMRIDVDDSVEPYAAPVRRYSPAVRTVIIDHVRKMLAQGVIEPSNSPWSANVITVPKKDGGFRTTLDYRVLNSHTRNVAANLPRVQDNLDVLGGAAVYSALDCLSGYYGLPLHEKHRDYTAFFCPGLGQFRFTRCSMGLRCSQQYFVTLTTRMLDGLLYESVAAFSDDIIVYSETVDKHIDVHLRQTFQRFRDFNVKVKASKADLCTPSLTWLGNLINRTGVKPDPAKIAAINALKVPDTLKRLRGFLGAANFLRKFIPRFAEITAPLRPLLKKGAFRSSFSETQVAAIDKLKQALTSAPVLVHPDWTKPFEIHADCSPNALGAALLQRNNSGDLQVISYLSKALTDVQKNYAHHEREALSVIYALETWRTYVTGSKTTVWTDSEAVAHIMKPNSKHTGRLLRYCIRLSEFDVEVKHKSGVLHLLPDCLSRDYPEDSICETPKTEPEPLYESLRVFLTMVTAQNEADQTAEEVHRRTRPNTRNARRLRDHDNAQKAKARALEPQEAPPSKPPKTLRLIGRQPKAFPSKPPKTLNPDERSPKRPRTRAAIRLKEHEKERAVTFLKKNIRLKSAREVTAETEKEHTPADFGTATSRHSVPEVQKLEDDEKEGSESNPYLDADQQRDDAADMVVEGPWSILQDVLDEREANAKDSREDWDSLFPHEPGAAAAALRPDLVFFDKQDNIPRIFRDRQRADTDLMHLTSRLTTTECQEACEGRVHSRQCLRRWYEISDDGLLRRVVRAPKPRVLNADAVNVRTQLRLHKCVCPWTAHTEQCPHRHHVLDEQACLYRQRTVLIVPRSLIPSILHHFHGAALSCHPGVTRTNSRISQRFYWKNKHKHIRSWVHSCLRCRMRKTPRPNNVVPPGIIPLSTGPMQTLVLDFSGPFNTTARGNRYILGIMCPFAKWPICVPLPSRKASGVTRALLEHVIQHYSAPRFILTDNARELIGKEMKAFCKVFGVTPLSTHPYTPQLNPFIERYHRVQAACLAILSSKYKDDWDLALPLITMAYRQTVNESTGYSPHHILFASEPRIGLDNVFDGEPTPVSVPDHVARMQDGLREIHAAVQQRHKKARLRNLDRRDDAFREVVYKPGDWVLLYSPKASEPLPQGMFRKKGLVDQWSPPAQIVSHGKTGGYYIVRDHNGHLQDVRADSMVSYRFYTDGLPAMPPRPRFTKEERAILAKNPEQFVPPDITRGSMVVFPMTMADGTPGFGVGKALEQLEDSSWQCQWFSNQEESLYDVFLPCWLDPQGRWYAGEQRRRDDPLTTKNIYPGKIKKRNVADVGFQLLPNHHLPNQVLMRIAQHDKFEWTLPPDDDVPDEEDELDSDTRMPLTTRN